MEATTRRLHRGRIKQIPIYLGKFFRMFVYQNDWKVLPMSALIAVIVAIVTGKNMFVTMEGTMMGSMALTCVCLWNGCFNSIQSVCRERGIVKREHRSGMHVSAYIGAHMIYQAALCMMQSIITLAVCAYAGMPFPKTGFLTGSIFLDLGVTLFLITYAADMMSLFISCVVRTTTSAMTVMPLVLIVQLVFSGMLFTSGAGSDVYSSLTIARWGMRAICTQANYNALPMVSVWNQLMKFQNMEIMGGYPVYEIAKYMSENGLKEEFLKLSGSMQMNPEYVYTKANVLYSWMHLIVFVLVFALLAMLVLRRVDRDKR